MANSLIQFTDDLRTKFTKMKTITIASSVVTGITIVGCLIYCGVITTQTRRQLAEQPIYILSESSILEANRVANNAQRDLEMKAHLRNFHNLMFSVAPTVTAINQNMERALELGDDSVYDFFMAQKEAAFYTKMVQAGCTQYVDSVVVELTADNTPCRTYCRVYYSILRKGETLRYYINTTCVLRDIARNEKNPYGILITEFETEDVQPIN